MKSALLAGACLGILFSSFASAEAAVESPARPQVRPLVGGHGDRIEDFAAQHDGDGDGELTWAEFDAFRHRRFAATDINGDGSVDVEEYVQEFDDRLREELENGRDSQVEQTKIRYRALDADKDGAISRAEYAASSEKMFAHFPSLPPGEKAKDGTSRRRDRLGMPTSHTREGFIALFDANGDGQIGRSEFDKARGEQFARTDSDGDGRLDQDEYLTEFEERLDRRIATVSSGSDKQTRVRFGSLDTDKNGLMTFAEYQVSGKRTFDRADRDHDGVVETQDAALPAPPTPERRAGAQAAGARTGD